MGKVRKKKSGKLAVLTEGQQNRSYEEIESMSASDVDADVERDLSSDDNSAEGGQPNGALAPSEIMTDKMQKEQEEQEEQEAAEKVKQEQEKREKEEKKTAEKVKQEQEKREKEEKKAAEKVKQEQEKREREEKKAAEKVKQEQEKREREEKKAAEEAELAQENKTALDKIKTYLASIEGDATASYIESNELTEDFLQRHKKEMKDALIAEANGDMKKLNRMMNEPKVRHAIDFQRSQFFKPSTTATAKALNKIANYESRDKEIIAQQLQSCVESILESHILSATAFKFCVNHKKEFLEKIKTACSNDAETVINKSKNATSMLSRIIDTQRSRMFKTSETNSRKELNTFISNLGYTGSEE